MKETVNVWIEDIIIPTYLTGPPQKNPMFLEKRVYQGSSGVVYPHPVIEKISDIKEDKVYNAIFLENTYIKIMVLPQLGGRIHMAYDKIKQRHFIYHNQVIKPALVGLTGPWISGGIEFNWPQHHRPSTFEPVDFALEENEDGSKTVWINEVERMFRMKGMAGFTLYPDKAYIEVRARLYNRTPLPQTFLWWANPAVKVNDFYQSIFPPDVYAVFDHGKRDVSSFPIATGTYYKVDYSPGTDISRYKNIPVPTSYMAVASRYNFIGGYEHDTGGGLLHVADHHISPGKKQWTWGNGEFGRAWNKNLTDEDGPYIELMTGVFTDNQPDFSWLQPYEEKTFTQYFMPYREVGVVKNASKDAVLGVDFTGNEIKIRLYLTAVFNHIQITVTGNGTLLFREVVMSGPESPYLKKIELAQAVNPYEITVEITDQETARTLISYKQEHAGKEEIPLPAEAAKRPANLNSNEQLYLTGLHLEQYRHATYLATDYYEEALRRDDKDARCNNALGRWYLRSAKFEKAESHFRKAVAALTQHNPNPYDGEPFYNLGLALKMQNKNDAAFDALYKCSWNDAWQHAGYLELARIAGIKKEYDEALKLICRSLIKNSHSHTARHLKVCFLRKLGRVAEALDFINESLQIDPFNFGCLFEKYLLQLSADKHADAAETSSEIWSRSHNWEHNFIEYSLDYMHAGLYDEGSELLLLYVGNNRLIYPMLYYYLGWFADRSGENEKAVKYFSQAARCDPAFCFPNRVEDVEVLQKAMELNGGDAKAPYYLGNFWYDKRQYEDAILCWEISVGIDDRFPTALRNLSLAYFNKRKDPPRAITALVSAFQLDTSDARILMELDQLHKILQKPPVERLAFLQEYSTLVESRDDLYLEQVTLHNQLGEYAIAKELIQQYKFHPWEGGEGQVVKQYLICHIELAKIAIEKNDFAAALQLLEEAQNYPANLGEGKLSGVQENNIQYLQGVIHEAAGEPSKADTCFKLATEGTHEPVQAIFYNDPQPDQILYRGLAWNKLGDSSKANIIFDRLIQFGRLHVDDDVEIDYFAVSLPDLLVFDVDLKLRNRIHCLYLMALGHLGLHNEESKVYFDQVLSLDCNHQGAIIHTRHVAMLTTGHVETGSC